MIATALLLAALSSPPHASADVDRAAIRHVVAERHPGERIGAVIIHGGYALASGRTSAGTSSHDGLHLTQAGWRVVCTFSPVPLPSQLIAGCGFPAAIATEISQNLSAHMAAQQGDFGMATIAEERAFAAAKGPDRDSERARVQLLRQLNEQMRTGLISRRQAIQKWNEFRLSWLLP